MKSVVITGANGFLGRHASRHFTAHGWRVFDIAWRLPDPRFADLLHDEAPDLCIHCAGLASVAQSFADPVLDFVSGPDLVRKLLLQIVRHSPGTRFLFLSSAAVYGNPATLPVSEVHATAPISPYGRHKATCEELCADYAERFRLRTASLRIFSAYGTGLRRQVVWDISRQALDQGEIMLQGTGKESRDFVHAHDIARAMETVAVNAPCRGECYNVATGHETTIAELADRIVRLLGVEVRPRFDGVLPPGVPRNWCADIGKLTALGFKPTWTLEAGLADLTSFLAPGFSPRLRPVPVTGATIEAASCP